MNIQDMSKVEIDNDRKASAIHEAAHAVIAFLYGIPTLKLILCDNPNNTKKGIAQTFINPKYDILKISKEDYNNPELNAEIIRRTTGLLFSIVAGDCAEKKYLNQHPDFPPIIVEESDGSRAFLIIEQLYLFNSKPFDAQKFRVIYFEFLNVIRRQFEKDRLLFCIIERLANKLLKSKTSEINCKQIMLMIFFQSAFYYLFKNHRPYAQINVLNLNELIDS